MSQNIQICHPPSQKSSHVWWWFPWIPLLVPSHYASEVANVFTQNCSRYVDIALTYDQTLALEDFDTNKNWQMLHVQQNCQCLKVWHIPMSSSFSHIFPCFFPYFSICFPFFSRIPSSRNPSSRNARAETTVHRGEPSADTATNRDVVLDRSRAKRRVQNVAQTWRSAEAKQNLEMFWVSAYYKMIITQNSHIFMRKKCYRLHYMQCCSTVL